MNNDNEDQSGKGDSSGHRAELCSTLLPSMDSTMQKKPLKLKKRKVYKSRLSYRSQWKSTYP